MPWCASCEKFWNPNSMPPDGTCPTCGAVIGEPPDTKVPWHFWLLMVGVFGYLGGRVVQGFGWLVDHTLAVPAIIGMALLAAGCVWWGVVALRRRDDESGEPAGG